MAGNAVKDGRYWYLHYLLVMCRGYHDIIRRSIDFAIVRYPGVRKILED
jgi:hypothetical protein